MLLGVLSPDRRRDAEGGRVPLAEVPKLTSNSDMVEVLITYKGSFYVTDQTISSCSL